jgi:Kef-type K+ transport system membrane component KefB
MHDNLIMGLLVLAAALLGLRLGIAVAVFEIGFGILAGNYLGVQPTEWLRHFADLGSLLLIFLAGSDIDVPFLRRRLRPVGLMGTVSFLAPFAVVLAYGLWVAEWDRNRALLMAIASATTSVALVYPVLRDEGLLHRDLGKTLLLVAFWPDFLVTVALFVFFAEVGWQTAVVVGLLASALWVFRHASLHFFDRYAGQTSSEVKLRFILALLLVLAFLSEKGNLHASLAVFLLGILVSDLMRRKPETDKRLRALAFSVFVPLFYFQAGLFFSIPAMGENLGMVLLLVALAFTAKFLGVYLTGRPYLQEHARYGAFLMNARLTFGTIAATYGLTHGIIDQAGFSVLISFIIVCSAIALLFAGRPPTLADH